MPAGTMEKIDIVQELNLPPVNIHCSVLAEDAIKTAVDDYKKKPRTQSDNERQAVSN
jgi:NifU-like protein involved in Fe-S cluster formation